MQILSLALELFEEALVDLIFLEVVDVVLEVDQLLLHAYHIAIHVLLQL